MTTSTYLKRDATAVSPVKITMPRPRLKVTFFVTNVTSGRTFIKKNHLLQQVKNIKYTGYALHTRAVRSDDAYTDIKNCEIVTGAFLCIRVSICSSYYRQVRSTFERYNMSLKKNYFDNFHSTSIWNNSRNEKYSKLN